MAPAFQKGPTDASYGCTLIQYIQEIYLVVDKEIGVGIDGLRDDCRAGPGWPENEDLNVIYTRQ